MARVLNAIFGDIRGKVGGVVFSANKSGSVLRRRVRGRNPRTAAQVQARNIFGTGGSSWDSLSVVEQQSWNQFASSGFKPLKKRGQGPSTGNQAFRGIAATAGNAAFKKLTCVFKAKSDGDTIPHTDADVAFSNVAPQFSVSPTLKNGSDEWKYLGITNGALEDDGSLSFDLNFYPTVVGGVVAEQFLDNNSKPFGLQFYISSAVKKESSACNDKLYYCVGNSGIPTFSGIKITSENAVTVSCDISDITDTFIAFPGVGSSVYLTVASLGEDGTLAIIGENFLTITAA
jgi:hypothetical protein